MKQLLDPGRALMPVKLLRWLNRRDSKSLANKPWQQSFAPRLESLEPRNLPSNISGYVFHDLNNNGLRDPGEPGLAGITLELRNLANQVIATTVSGPNGYYVFDRDQTISQTEQVLSRTLTFSDTRTNTSVSQNISQFDPSLGRLVAVDIVIQGRVTSTIQAENLDPSPASVSATFSGSLTVTGPGLNATVTTSSDSVSYNAGPYDGHSDFAGASGVTLGPRTVNGSRTITLSDPNILSSWIGTGTVTLTAVGRTTSSVNGGNLLAQINATAGADITIRYRYIPSNALRPGTYTIRQVQQPSGYLDGLESQGGAIIPGTIGTDIITVVLTNQDNVENNFAEILPSNIQGFVYHDLNANGFREAGEPGIAGVTIQLTGINDLGQTVQFQVPTGSDGFYRFSNLRPGSYNLQQIQPQQYLDGRDTIAPLNGLSAQSLGILGNDSISLISLGQGSTYGNYDFGEVLPASLQGYVFLDANLNGIRDSGETGVNGVTIRLTGTDDLGNNVQLSTTTSADGTFAFSNLRPGRYMISKVQPPGYLEGETHVGSAGGVLAANSVGQIVLSSGTSATGYSFALVTPGSLGGGVYHDADNNGRWDPNERGISGVKIVLTGTDYRGNYVEIEQKTGPSGRFLFDSLAPGTYAIYEVQPSGYLDGKDTLGALGGYWQNDLFTGIKLQSGSLATNYLFGELLPASLGGYVYLDTNGNGVRDVNDRGLAGVTLILTGTNDLGRAIRLTTKSAADGSYRFSNLRPGVYAIYQMQPNGYAEGSITIGSLGGQRTGTNLISKIKVSSGKNGTNYNFGEVLPIKPSSNPPSLPSKRNFLGSRRR